MNGETPLHQDLLQGAQAIAEYVFGKTDRATLRKTYHWLERGFLPAKKLGSVWVARKSQLDQFCN